MKSSPFEVWAPKAQKVELVLDDGTYEMTRVERGSWRVEHPGPPGTRYRYLVDGQGPFPDPRSQWQPEGVHGPSAIVDHERHVWNDSAFVPKPLSRAVLYELHIGTFTPEGTYASAERALPHLCELGVTHLELMPIHAFPGVHGWGYDGVALYAPHAPYGTPDELKHFVEACHAHGLAVLLDVVYNHLGPDGAYAGAFAPYFTSRFRTPWGDAVNFDFQQSDGVRAFVVNNALMWLRDYHFDGLRLDACHELYDHGAVHILEELAVEVCHLSARTGRDYVVTAESDLNAPRMVLPRDRGGYGLDAHWADDFHHALHAFFTGERDGIHMDFGSLAYVAKALRQGYVYDGQPSAYRKKKHGRPPSGVAPSQLVVFAQNHDQTGNRAVGERLGHLLERNVSKAIAALVLLSPFVPMLFQGEEWGASTPFLYFTDHHEEMGRLVTEGRRKDFETFGWATGEIPDPQLPDTFQRSKLLWEERTEPAHHE
ncbi:MAG: malto-oligosyltrehalose trehalohydrolase, partial [Proteobacteria bacterium]